MWIGGILGVVALIGLVVCLALLFRSMRQNRKE
jgi:hypothetical protein